MNVLTRDELYDLYKRDKHFRHYADSECKKRECELLEVLDLKILREYAKYLKERNCNE